MDNSETYIKMCEKARKYLPPWEVQEGDCFIQVYGNGEYSESLFVSGSFDAPQYEEKPIFRDNLFAFPLYRQDQLQEMVNMHVPFLIREDYLSATFDKIIRELGSRATWEQFWLAFVMKEKYNKIWDGEKWLTDQRQKET